MAGYSDRVTQRLIANLRRRAGAVTPGGGLAAAPQGRFKRPPKVAGLPGVLAGRGGKAKPCPIVDPKDGAVRRPYTLIGRIQLAAAAQAINTDLGDFLDAASVDDITTDNVVPFGVTITSAQLYVGLNELIAAPINNPAMMSGFSIRFLVNGIEEARWPIAKFNPVFSNNGLVTSGGGATMFQAKYEPVPFFIDFDPDKTYSLGLFNTRAVTPAAVTDLTLILDGMR